MISRDAVANELSHERDAAKRVALARRLLREVSEAMEAGEQRDYVADLRVVAAALQVPGGTA